MIHDGLSNEQMNEKLIQNSSGGKNTGDDKETKVIQRLKTTL